MTEGPGTSNFDNYILEIHDRLDRLRELPDADDQCSVLVGDLAEAYSEQPSSMQTGNRKKVLNIEVKLNCVFF